MKRSLILLCAMVFTMLFSCKPEAEEKKSIYDNQPAVSAKTKTTEEKTKPSETIDLTTKGIGPVANLNLPQEIDAALAAEGKSLFNRSCTACHKVEKRMIGPAMKGIVERRHPEWIMNMILNPQEMAIKDPLAKALLEEFNQAIMPVQGVTEEQARAMLEYFRTL